MVFHNHDFFLENVIFFSKKSWLEKFSETVKLSRRCHGWKKISWKKNFMKKNFIERIIFSKFGQKRHGWAKIKVSGTLKFSRRCHGWIKISWKKISCSRASPNFAQHVPFLSTKVIQGRGTNYQRNGTYIEISQW